MNGGDVGRILVIKHARQAPAFLLESGLVQLFEKHRDAGRNSGVEHVVHAARHDLVDGSAVFIVINRKILFADDFTTVFLDHLARVGV